METTVWKPRVSLFACELGVFLAAFAASVPGSEPRLVKDINLTRWAGTCLRLSRSAAVGSRLFFVGEDYRSGRELWVSDGTEAGTRLVKDISPGQAGSHLRQLTATGGRLFFEAFEPEHGAELWVSDGTEAGTFLLKDIYPGRETSNLSLLAGAGGVLYFLAADPEHGTELWVSDGTQEGTRLLKDIRPGPDGCAVYGCRPDSEWFAILGGKAFFLADDGDHGCELWVSDGTGGGTRLLRDLTPGSDSTSWVFLRGGGERLFFGLFDASWVKELWVSDGTEDGTRCLKRWESATGPYKLLGFLRAGGERLLFSLGDPEHGAELWISDGTEEGTVLVKDICPGPRGSNPSSVGGAEEFAFPDGRFFFFADDGEHGEELWVTDGTEAGTALVKDFWPGPDGSRLEGFALAGGRLFFQVFISDDWAGLWVTDGTETGTEMVYRLDPEPEAPFGARVQVLLGVGERAYFAVLSPGGDWQLWVTDGTKEGTRFLKRIGHVAELHCRDQEWLYAWFAPLGDRLFFIAQEARGLFELWVSDGTDAGTTRVGRLDQARLGSGPGPFGALGGRVVFPASDSTGERRLWVSSGTELSTRPLRDVEPILPLRGRGAFVRLGGRLFFESAFSRGLGPWVTDGTLAGTKLLWLPGSPWTFDPHDAGLIPFREGVFYCAGRPELGFTFWVLDGTELGGRILGALGPGMLAKYPGPFAAVGSRLFFAADDGVHGWELWMWDAERSRGGLVKDISPGKYWSAPRFLTPVGDRLFFVAMEARYKEQVWVSDGTEEGTHVVKAIAADRSLGASPYGLTSAGNRLYFVAVTREHGGELWVSDGTEAGTVLVKDVYPGPNWSNPQELVGVGSRVFFVATVPENGLELWVSDGTAEGTRLVKDIVPGPSGSEPRKLTAVGDLLFFTAEDPHCGRELWISDGTEVGTRQLADINPGKDGSDPSWVTAADGWLFFSAYDVEHGRELWAIPPESEEPRADFAMDPEPCQLGRRVLLDGAASWPGEGRAIVSYVWDVGFGVVLEAERAEWEYPEGASGLQEICLTVTNDKGLSDTACRQFCIGVEFRRGDVNADRSVDLADVIATLKWLFSDGEALSCADAADADDNGVLEITDAVRTAGFLYLGREPPPTPGPGSCGIDPTDDALGDCRYDEAFCP